ncbi:MAG: signal peptidase II [Acidimicrobiales bacterium]|nr:signal peptidase II [Acidimicrobiales bacterium]
MATRTGTSRHLGLTLGVALAVYTFDQLTKWWALERLSDGRTVDVVGSLRFNLAFNSGAAFSQGTGLGPVIALVAIVVVVALLWTSRSATSRTSAVAVGLVVGGAVGNLSDRLLREGPGGFLGGAVVDFVDLQWWPIFNVADAGVVVGGILLVLSAGLAGRGDGGDGDAAADGDADAAADGDGDAVADGEADPHLGPGR